MSVCCPGLINKKRANPEMKRRTQHHGYEFSYRYRKIMQRLPQGLASELTALNARLFPRLYQQQYLEAEENDNLCIIVNEYLQNQGML